MPVFLSINHQNSIDAILRKICCLVCYCFSIRMSAGLVVKALKMDRQAEHPSLRHRFAYISIGVLYSKQTKIAALGRFVFMKLITFITGSTQIPSG